MCRGGGGVLKYRWRPHITNNIGHEGGWYFKSVGDPYKDDDHDNTYHIGYIKDYRKAPVCTR